MARGVFHFLTPLLLAAWWLGTAAVGRAQNLAWTQEKGFRSAPLTVPRDGRAGFTLLSEAATGVAFTNHLADASAASNQVRLVGSGVALGDVDGDGLCDIYLCRLEGENALYRNRGGWRFEEVTARAGVGCVEQYSTGGAFADVDGDGDLDLLVNALSVGTRLFINDGEGAFGESAQGALRTARGATSLALADVDGDGDLDLYVANYRTNTIRSTGLKVLNVGGRQRVRPEDREQYEFTKAGLILEHGDVDVLFVNDGRGGFTPVSWSGGAFLDEDGKALAAGPKDWGLSCAFRDLDGDGRLDLYVCNDFHSPDRVWLNRTTNGAVRFRAAPRLMLRNTSTFSMGVDFADLNRDGWDDFMVLDMLSREHPRRLRQRSLMGAEATGVSGIEDRPQVDRNTLFVNRGDGTFAELAQFAGLQASDWSWAVAFMDVDLDGYEDALITTGHAFDTQDVDTEARLAARGPAPAGRTGESLLEFPRLHIPNIAFRNRGDLTFEEVGAKWGFNLVGVSHGLALADLDNDGDLDVVVNNLNSAVSLYRNESAAPRVAVRLKGRGANTRGIGARVRLEGRLPQSQVMAAGGRYLSGDETVRMFAAAAGNASLEVTWPGGGHSLITNVQPNHVYEVAEPLAAPVTFHVSRFTNPPPLFREVALPHIHREEPFNDFARQPLLPRRLSQLGPGVSWIDVDGDGREDLCIGAGRGAALAIFRNRGDGGFDAMRTGGPLARATDDFTTILGWPSAPGATTLLVGQANYESAGTNPSAVMRFEIVGGAMKGGEPIAGWNSSPGPLALGDIEGDGDLDLFVGGRTVAGRWPEAASSRLFRNDAGTFVVAKEWPRLGLVSGATFSDLTGDGLAELIVVQELGPLIVFRNERGVFSEWDAPVRGEARGPALPEKRAGQETGAALSSLLGWWAGVTTGDFDGDGRLDIVAANMGRNTPCQPFLRDGWRVFQGDLSGRGGPDIIEAIYDSAYRRLAPWRELDTLSQTLPWLRERFSASAAFSEANLEQIMGGKFKQCHELRANWADTTVFLNRGDHFEAQSLPDEAQWAPAFGVCAADADGDGREDIFLSQNFFGVDERTSRFDAGRGLWLKGDGKGGFRAVSGQESGIEVYGEQRGAALCDYDGDGRMDLAVSQNSAATKLYRNERAIPGAAVRLSGPPGNGSGIGAVMRWEGGAAREVRGGSGYWSQDAAVQVLVRPRDAARLTVRWPGGKTTVSEVSPAAREITVAPDGTVTVQRPAP